MSSTYFLSIGKSYKQVHLINQNEIPVDSFLEATETLIKILESLGSAFSPVKSDMQGNVNKIRAVYLADPSVSTLQAIVIKERAEKKKAAMEALLWLKRALEFTSKGLVLNRQDQNQELSASFTKAYESTLSPFHSFLVRPIFFVAMKACPRRSDFYKRLSNGQDDAEFFKEFNSWLDALDKLVTILIEFYISGGYDKF